MGKTSAKSAKTEVELVVPEPTLVTPPLPGADSSALPFNEWSDQDVNTEKWSADTKGKAKKGAEADEIKLYEDPQVVRLPISIIPYEWKRPSEVYPEAQFTIYDDQPVYPDLISGSKHLLHSEFVRSFISSVETLMYLGNTRQFTTPEYTSPLYTPNTGDCPWRPWHHIYSGAKISKTQEHAPVVNGIGKYIVRLFWLGSWRKIYVDDLLPVDMLNHVLLPSLELTKEELEKRVAEDPPPTPITVESDKKSKGSDKKKAPEIKFIEIWPFLLSKALLKIASLTWYDDREILDFDIIQCLTGWVPQKLNTKGLNIADIWEICAAYTNHFCWPPDQSEVGTKDGKKGKDDKGKKGKAGAEDEMEPWLNAHHLMARCNDLRILAEDQILDISPCWSHYFLIDQTRDIPLIKPTLTVDLAFWKTFRWLDWAVETGLISPEENVAQIRCFKLVSPFKKIYEHVVYKQPSKLAIEIEKTVNIIDEVEKGKKGKGDKDKGKDKDTKKSSESKSSKDSKGSKGKKKIDLSAIPDPSIWVDYGKLSNEINTVVVYLKPSKFKTKIKITDMAAAASKDAKGANPKKKAEPAGEWKNFIYPKDPRECRNEPVYIFVDSVDYKLFTFNLLQTGYTPIFEKRHDKEESPNLNEEITECEFCVAALVKRIKKNITKLDKKNYILLTPNEPKPIMHDRPKAHLVLEKFNWQTERVGDMLTSIYTYGAKATVLDLSPGRHVFRLWIKSDTSYVLQFFSDTPVACGFLEQVLFSMSQEPQLLISMCMDAASNFGKLVQSFGMPEFPLQLRSYYASYKPISDLTKAECNTIHDTFYHILCNTVAQTMGKNELDALKILFFRWQLPREIFSQLEPLEFCNCYDEDEDFDFVKAMERYVVKIQYFFMGIYERSLMKHHNPDHKNYFSTFELLKNVYTQIFAANKRLITCPTLFRIFLSVPEMNEIKGKYRVYDDLDNVILLQEVTGSLEVPENEWAFICRQQFFIISRNPLLLKINLFCDINQYIVRVIDNDTKNEIRRYTNNVTVNEYETNVNGYTVLCYGWSTTTMQMHYKLSFSTKKELNEHRLLVPALTSQVELITGNYIPNISNYICRYLVHVTSDNVLLTTRFWTCNENVIVNLKIMDDYGVLLQEVTGKKNIVLPAVVLEYREKEEVKKASEASIRSKKISITSSNSGKSLERTSKSSDRNMKSLRSLRSKKSSESRKTIRSEVSEVSEQIVQETIYVIEATVVDASWPLKIEEWRGVHVLKTDMLYGATLTEGSSTVERTSSKKSVESAKNRSVSKHSDSCGSESKQSESIVIETPYWILQTICNAGDPVQFTQDTRRENQIRDIKYKWYELDPMRYHISQKLRQTYLKENRIYNDYLPEDISGMRHLDVNFFATEILPPYDISEFIVRKKPITLGCEELEACSGEGTMSDEMLDEYIYAYRNMSGDGSQPYLEENQSPIDTSQHNTETGNLGEEVNVLSPEDLEHANVEELVAEEEQTVEDNRMLKTAQDFENDIQDEILLLEEFDIAHEQRMEDMDNFVAEQIENFETLDSWFEECRQDSVEMITYALNLKSEYIKNVLDAINKEKEREKEKAEKEKGDKKGKGDKKK